MPGVNSGRTVAIRFRLLAGELATRARGGRRRRGADRGGGRTGKLSLTDVVGQLLRLAAAAPIVPAFVPAASPRPRKCPENRDEFK